MFKNVCGGNYGGDFMSEMLKKYAIYAITFVAGAFIGANYFPREIETKIIEKPTIVQGETKNTVDTKIVYVPKDRIVYVDKVTGASKVELEETDLDASVGKQNFVVKLNGKEISFTKSDDEKFIFDKNKIALQQYSDITFNATVEPPVIDKTKRWGLGVGYGSHGKAGIVKFPVNNTKCWAYVDDDTKAGGLIFEF